MVNMNRNDATGFRLDTLTTHKQYSTPDTQGSEVLSTRTDYVNKYPSVLQTTSYNFSRTGTTAELCAGVVKAPKVHGKNPAQHITDLCKLENHSELIPVFVNMQTGMPKSAECIRLDGASYAAIIIAQGGYYDMDIIHVHVLLDTSDILAS